MDSTTDASIHPRPLTLRSAAVFVAIGLIIYGVVYGWSERLVYRTGDSNPFFKIATADMLDIDWAILGASHAMPLDYADFNAFMERETGTKILNLAATGAGPLYNRFVLEHLFERGGTENVLYVVDSFAFRSPDWNEERFSDAKLIRYTPFDPAIVRRLFSYSLNEGVAASAVLDYMSGFSKINNRDRFKRDVWEGEAQFERVFRPSSSADSKRIEYLYPDGAEDEQILERYLSELGSMIELAETHGARFVIIKPPVPERFRRLLPNEEAFDSAVSELAEETGAEFRDFSGSFEDPDFYSDTDHLNRAGLTRFFEQSLRPIIRSGTAEH